MAHLGHPILGDTLYSELPINIIKRQALHSFKMEFIHPITNKQVNLTAPLPNDMISLFQEKYFKL